MARRSFAVAGWLAAVVLATLVGMAAIRLLGDSIAPTPGGVRSQDDIARELRELAATPTAGPATPTAPPPATTSPAHTPNRKTFASPGGSIFARCDGDAAYIDSWTPNQGYALRDVDEGPDHEAEAKFVGRGGSFEIKIRCVDGRPVQVPDDDD